MDRNYTEYTLKSTDTGKEDKLDTIIDNPKFFPGEIIDNNMTILKESDCRKNIIYGILLLDSTTHGRKKNKFYYKFIPFIKNMPICLVPYELKNSSFSKFKINKYATCKFVNWDNKHPEFLLTNIIGDVNDMSAFSEYLIGSYNITHSLKKLNKLVKNNDIDSTIKLIINKYNLMDRTDLDIISIDPPNCKDIDDAIGLTNNKHMCILSIYISNVPLIIEYFNLWKQIGENISSLYLPDKKRPMLPFLLSENMCSLKENNIRIAMALDITIDTHINQIIKTSFIPCFIKVRKNFSYDEPQLITDKLYINITKLINNSGCFKNKFINDSHEAIELLMIFMNKTAANKLADKSIVSPVYKSCSISNTSTENVPTKIDNFIKGWGGSGSNYTLEKKVHKLLEYELYTQVTSPIRRYVDIINMTYLNFLCKIELLPEFNTDLSYINIQVKNIKKVETQINLLELANSDKFKNKIYSAFIIEKENDYVIIYLNEINKILKIKGSNNLLLFQPVKCKLHLFNYEYETNKKVRATIVN